MSPITYQGIPCTSYTLTDLRRAQDRAFNVFEEDPDKENLRLFLRALHMHICQLSDACEQHLLKE